VALLSFGTIAWRALSAQNRSMSGLALTSNAARYHQDAASPNMKKLSGER
jgi:hypothetical protein